MSDSEQVHVASLPNSADGKYVTVVSPEGTSLTEVAAAENPSPADAPAGYEFPIGFLDFSLNDVALGAATTVTIVLPPDSRFDTYYKYGLEPENHLATAIDETTEAHWYEFLYDGTTGAEFFDDDGDGDTDRIVLHFVDGQRGDNDLIANGVVVDPGAPGLQPNDPPVSDPNGPYTVAEGGSLQLDGAGSTDPNQDSETLRYKWDLDGNGVYGEASTAHGDENGRFTTYLVGDLDGPAEMNVSLRVIDDGGLEDTAIATIKLTNTAPSATLSNNGPVDEGSTAEVNFSDQYDPSSSDFQKGFTYFYDFDNDGTFEIDGSAEASAVVPAQYLADGPDTRTVAGRIQDKDGDWNEYVTDVTVLNVTPTVDAGGPITIDEGEELLRTGSFVDPGNDTWETFVDYGDGVGPQPVMLGNDKTFELSHTYADNGVYNVTLTVTDDDGDMGTDSFNVSVANVAPVVDAGEDRTAFEGEQLELKSVTFTDAGTADTHEAVIDWGDGMVDTIDPATSPLSGSHVYADDGTYEVTVRVRDDDMEDPEQWVESFFDVFVANVPPQLTNLTTTPGIAEDRHVTIAAGIVDPGLQDSFELDVDWGDGNAETFAYAAGTTEFVEEHQYETGGIFDINVRLTDKDGGEDAAEAVVMATGARGHEGTLQVVGTQANDHVLIGNARRQMFVTADFLPGFHHLKRFDKTDIEAIDVVLGDGNDRAVVTGNVSVPAKLDGGPGNDFLKGAQGNDILLGGDGRDLLVGHRGRDLLIGGSGRDRLVGNRGDDILIGGYTAYDANELALAAVMAEWTSGRDYSTRVENLRRDGSGPQLNDNYFLIAQDGEEFNPVATVFDDDARDVLTGSHGVDWFFANCRHDDEARRDRITDLKADELVEDLDWIEQMELMEEPKA
ncbi:MAG: PKD domain-containing protein [Pirellulaceae bacterium]